MRRYEYAVQITQFIGADYSFCFWHALSPLTTNPSLGTHMSSPREMQTARERKWIMAMI
jgi:hypothetical protein